jgi:hypothetical protein
MKNQCNMKTFNDTEKQFLANYRPADKHFTYASEIEQIVKTLNLINMSKEQLQETRNAVVDYYSELMDVEGANWRELNRACQSVTQVVDATLYCDAIVEAIKSSLPAKGTECICPNCGTIIDECRKGYCEGCHEVYGA